MPRRIPPDGAWTGACRPACRAISSTGSPLHGKHRGPASDGDHHAHRRTGITAGPGALAARHHRETKRSCRSAISSSSSASSPRRRGFAIAVSSWTRRASCAPGRRITGLARCRSNRAFRASSPSATSALAPRSEWAGRSERAPRWWRSSTPCSRTLPRRCLHFARALDERRPRAWQPRAVAALIETAAKGVDVTAR